MICDRSNGDAKPFGDLRIDQFLDTDRDKVLAVPAAPPIHCALGEPQSNPLLERLAGARRPASARFILSYFFSLQNRRGLAREERRVAAGRSRQTRINRFMRLDEVLGITNLSRATLYRKIQAGTFPHQHKLAERCCGWKAYEVDVWLSNPATFTSRTSDAARLEPSPNKLPSAGEGSSRH